MAAVDPLAPGVEVLDEEFLHHARRGSHLLARGDAEGAASALARARQLRPGDAQVLGLLGQALYRLGRLDEAAAAYQELADASPHEPSPRVNLGLARLKARRLDEAIREFERALELQPDHERTLRYLGLAWLERGDPARAREWFSRARSETMVARCDELLARAAEAESAAAEAEEEGAPGVPRLHHLGAGLGAPFELEGGLLVSRVAGELLARHGGLVAVRGAVRITTAPRLQRGEPTDRMFGEGDGRMLRASGNGALVHALPGRWLSRLELDRFRPASVREDVLLAFEGTLAYENGRVASQLGTDLDIVQLRGRGAALLATAHDLVSLDVTPDVPVRVPVGALAGWVGAVTPRFGLLVEGVPVGARGAADLAVELTGNGRVLVEGAAA